MAGGVFAGVLGPQLVQWTMDIWPPYLFAFSFMMQAFVVTLREGLEAFLTSNHVLQRRLECVGQTCVGDNHDADHGNAARPWCSAHRPRSPAGSHRVPKGGA